LLAAFAAKDGFASAVEKAAVTAATHGAMALNAVTGHSAVVGLRDGLISQG
jgi:hypothetical protein